MKFLTNDKLTIVGAAGMIGSNMVQTALMMGLTSDICLYDVFSPEGVADAIEQMGDKTGKGSAVESFFASTDEDVQRILGLAETVDLLREKIEELEDAGDIGTAAQLTDETSATIGEIDQQLNSLTDQDLASIGQEAAQLMAALSSGDLDAEQMELFNEVRQLQATEDHEDSDSAENQEES